MHRSTLALFSAAALLSGCSFASDALWPSLTGDEPAAEASQQVPIQPSVAEANQQPTLGPTAQAAPAPPGLPAPPPALGTTNFAPQPITNTPTTGTFVGQKVGQLRGELRQLQGRLSQQNSELQQIRQTTTQNAQRYHGTVAAVTARLQLGTTPGNPVLVSQWNAAQAELDRLNADIAAMNSLANLVASNSSLAAYILESARASYSLSGAIDEDHRQLAILEDETNRTVVLVDRLLAELNEDVARQTAYVGNERANLTTLSNAIKNGELFGSSLLARAYGAGSAGAGAGAGIAAAPAPSPFATSSTPRSGFATTGRRPLVVIRFDRPDVPYEQALYTAVSRTLDRRPDAQFDLVAVVPAVGTASEVAATQSQSKRNANRVLRTLTDMGLPASRVSLASTTSPSASSSEVHIYLR